LTIIDPVVEPKKRGRPKRTDEQPTTSRDAAIQEASLLEENILHRLIRM
jgi:hypothetical protein